MTTTGPDQRQAANRSRSPSFSSPGDHDWGATDWSAVAKELCRHEAVAEAVVLPSGAGNTAYVVVDADQAPLLHRACQLLDAGRLDGLAWHEPDDDLLLAQVNRSETDFLYQEIFANNAYLRHGVCLTEGAIVVDVGANIGMFTVLAAARCRGVRVVAIEPVAELARAVEVNAALHSIDATVVNCALGSRAGEADFTFYPGNTVMSGLHADRDEDREVLRSYLMTGDGAEHNRQLDAMVADRLAPRHRTCRIDTLSAVVARHHLERIDLLKIDVEKAEREVLAGVDGATWELVDQIVIEVHDLQGRLGEILELLAARGFVTTSDQDPRLAHTPCHTVYGQRLRAERRPSALPLSPRWATRRALEGALRERLATHEPRLAAPDAIEVVLALPDAVEPGSGVVEEPGSGAAAEPGVDVPSCRGGRGRAVLAEIWATLFGVAAVRDEADFFDLGGDSLTAVRLLVKLEERLGDDVVAPDTVFIASRFADLAAAVDAALAARSPA